MNQLLLPSKRREPRDTLLFAPLAWLKLQWFCHAGGTEVGGFGVSAERDPLYIEDFVTVRQRTSPFNVCFDDEAVADLFDELVDRGLKPERFARIWMHTHPGTSPQPSSTDETTFARSFGSCDWSVMFIVSRTSQTYARLSFPAGPGGEVLLPVAVDWAAWPSTSATVGGLDAYCRRWQQEYAAHVRPIPNDPLPLVVKAAEPVDLGLDWWDAEPWDEELDRVRYEPVYEGDLHELLF
jgi:proteasome lid subunit RPN8/RPN11